MKGWVGLVGWPVADGLPTLVVTHQLQVERGTGKVRRPETDVLPLSHATNLQSNSNRLVFTLHPLLGDQGCTRKAIGNKSVLIQLAQCRFPEQAISNAKILTYLSNKIYGSNLIKQDSETAMVWNYQNADCSLRKKNYCVIYCNFWHTLDPYQPVSHSKPSISH